MAFKVIKTAQAAEFAVQGNGKLIAAPFICQTVISEHGRGAYTQTIK